MYNTSVFWQIAVVSQEPVLFSGSIRDNIAYGLTGCSLDEIQEAARKANAHDFIKQLDKGYDTGWSSLHDVLHEWLCVVRNLLCKKVWWMMESAEQDCEKCCFHLNIHVD